MSAPLRTSGFRRLLAGLALCLAPLFVWPLAAETGNDASLRQLRLKNFVMPEFPEFLRMTGVNRGVVTAAIGRDAEGYVTDVFVLASDHARLTDSVVTAVRQWRFALPAQRPPPGQEIVPVVRFLFTTKGVQILPGSGTVGGGSTNAHLDAPMVIPTFADLDAKPKAMEQVMPRLAGSSVERLQQGGSATVKFFVDEQGKVRVPVILDCTAADLGQAAIAAVEQWRYEPPLIAGRPTIVRETMKLDFTPVP